MARKRHTDEDVLKLLREIELKLTAGKEVASECRGVGIRYASYGNWRKRLGGMGRLRLSETKSLVKENARLWCEEGSQLLQRHKTRKRLYHKDSSIIRMRPAHPNRVWAIDFAHDNSVTGGRTRC